MTTVLARLRGVERRFGSVVALAGADLEIRAGEVHGVLGANGAGKSTLLNVLGGMIRPDAGVVEVGGVETHFAGPRDAWRHRIALVHQHFTLVPPLSVGENLALGHPRGRVSPEAVARLMAKTGLRVPLEVQAERLGVGDRQRVEILKALLRDPEILVLDEPTAVLAPSEIDGLFALLKDLAASGRAVVLVAHKLDEVLGVAHRVTVLRDGKSVLVATPAEHGVRDFVRAMVGVEVAERVAAGVATVAEIDVSAPARQRERVVHLEDVHLGDDRGPRLRGVDLEVFSGEIIGVAGVEGNGQHELALVLADRVSPERGSAGLPQGIGFIPEDRSTEGLIADFDLTENVALALHRDSTYVERGWLRWPALREVAEEVRSVYEIETPAITARVGAMSGGNQQRVVVGREVAMARGLLVAENPTRGLDVSAAVFVHSELRRLAARGVAVVLLSTDLDEVLTLSDRVFAMTSGRLLAVPVGTSTREGVGALMLVGSEDSTHA